LFHVIQLLPQSPVTIINKTITPPSNTPNQLQPASRIKSQPVATTSNKKLTNKQQTSASSQVNSIRILANNNNNNNTNNSKINSTTINNNKDVLLSNTTTTTKLITMTSSSSNKLPSVQTKSQLTNQTQITPTTITQSKPKIITQNNNFLKFNNNNNNNNLTAIKIQSNQHLLHQQTASSNTNLNKLNTNIRKQANTNQMKSIKSEQDHLICFDE